MIGFALFLVGVCAAGYAVISAESAWNKRTLPQPDEMTMQFASIGVTESIEQQPRFTVPVKNSHWFIHTFMRPRRKKG